MALKGKYRLVSIKLLLFTYKFVLFQVDIYYQNKIIPDPFSLIDVAFTFNWDRVSSIHFVSTVYLSDKINVFVKKIVLVQMYQKYQYRRTIHSVFINVKL